MAEQTVNRVVTIGATLLVGLVVFSFIADSMPEDNIPTELDGTWELVLSTVGSAFDLAAVLPIVIVAAGMLYYVSNFGGSRQRRE